MTIEWKEYENGKSEKNFFLTCFYGVETIALSKEIKFCYHSNNKREREREKTRRRNEQVHLVDSLFLDV